MKKSILFNFTIKFFLVNAFVGFAQVSKNNKEFFYVLGDTYHNTSENNSLELLDSHLKSVKENVNILFLGNDLNYDRLRDCNELKTAQLYFTAGNLEWQNKTSGVNKLSGNIKEKFSVSDSQIFNSCPIQTKSIGENIELITLNSQWFLQDWDKDPEMNINCVIKTRELFFQELEDIINSNDHKIILLATHHPLLSNSIHGGNFKFKDQLFPFNKYVPVPVLGSLYCQIRSQGGVYSQDISSKRYSNFSKRIKSILHEKENVFVVSSHDRNLQLIEEGNIKQIISGASGDPFLEALKHNGIFASEENGFVKIEAGSDYCQFEFLTSDGKVVKSKYSKKYNLFNNSSNDFVFKNVVKDSIAKSVYTNRDVEKSPLFKTFFGNLYREEYGKEIKFKSVKLDTLYGGLYVDKELGNDKYKKIVLKNDNGDSFEMRSVNKKTIDFLQTSVFKHNYLKDDYSETVLDNAISDIYTGALPYAFKVMPELYEQIDLNYLKTNIFYVPKQKALGSYNSSFGDDIYVVSCNLKENTFSTEEILEELKKESSCKIEEEKYIRTRLFDMLVGDWDRNQKKYSWVQKRKDSTTICYEPIPLDREQAFSNYDGFLMGFTRFIMAQANQLPMYNGKPSKKEIRWLNHSSIQLDRLLLKQSKKKAWIKEVGLIQERLTDEVIDTAFLNLPKEFSEELVNNIKFNLKKRRDNLFKIALEYYSQMQKLVLLRATNKMDFIFLKSMEGGKVKVVFKDNNGSVLSTKVYSENETDEIWIYGLGGKDFIDIDKTITSSIKIKVIGGKEVDNIKVKNASNTTIYSYKSEKDNIESESSSVTKTIYSDKYDYNTYDIKKDITVSNSIFPVAGFNPDDGFFLGATDVYTKKSFVRFPFEYQHKFTFDHYFATGGFDLIYKGTYSDVIKDSWSLSTDVILTSENYARNFFGYGNETSNSDGEKGVDYNRVKISDYIFGASMFKEKYNGLNYGFGFNIEGANVAKTEERFISDSGLFDNNTFFEQKYFANLGLNFGFVNIDNVAIPTRGMDFKLNTNFYSNINSTYTKLTAVNTELKFYNALTDNKRLVLHSKFYYQFRAGQDYYFYQAANIGGDTGLRGYRVQRFTGDKSFVSSFDLKYQFNSIKTNIVPLNFGGYIGYDTGRVWLNGQYSTKWHNSYGGGISISTSNILSVSASLFGSEEGARLTFGFIINN